MAATRFKQVGTVAKDWKLWNAPKHQFGTFHKKGGRKKVRGRCPHWLVRKALFKHFSCASILFSFSTLHSCNWYFRPSWLKEAFRCWKVFNWETYFWKWDEIYIVTFGMSDERYSGSYLIPFLGAQEVSSYMFRQHVGHQCFIPASHLIHFLLLFMNFNLP